MSLFIETETTSARLKMGFMGFAGSGKTRTATDTAIGLIKYMRELGLPEGNRPLYFLDTEKGSDWMRPRAAAAGVKMVPFKSRAFSDLLIAIPEAEERAAVLIVDSVTHFWVELCRAYMVVKKRTRLQFEDWVYLKAEWAKFTDMFVNSNLHIMILGRAGFEYDYFKDEDTGKKNLEKTDIKMKAENETGYEPDLLVLMERETDLKTDPVTVNHVATILKDRGDLLDGQKFNNPTFETFLPHIKLLNMVGRQMGVDTTRSSVSAIPADIRDTRGKQVTIVLEKIEALVTYHYPSTNAAARTAKIDLYKSHFGTTSWTEVQGMSLERLRSAYNSMHVELRGDPSEYAKPEQAKVDLKTELNDELPGDLAPLKAANGATEASWIELMTA